MRPRPQDPKQINWLAHEHARRENPETSHAAAESMEPTANAIADKILRSLKEYGPATFSKLAIRLNMRQAQVWRRISDLKNRGVIESTGETLAGPSGRQQTVWRAK